MLREVKGRGMVGVGEWKGVSFFLGETLPWFFLPAEFACLLGWQGVDGLGCVGLGFLHDFFLLCAGLSWHIIPPPFLTSCPPYPLFEVFFFVLYHLHSSG